MGGGIAQVRRLRGGSRSTTPNPGATDKRSSRCAKSLTKLAEKGGADRTTCSRGSRPSTTSSSADLMVEAVVEDADVKKDIFRRADEGYRPDAILASNTSSIPIASLAAETQRPDQVIGMHFFNPVPVLAGRGVRHRDTSDETAAAVVELARDSARRRRRRTTSPASSRTGS